MNSIDNFSEAIALVVAFDALGLPAVAEVLQRLLPWPPNLVVALVVLAITGLAANALGKLVRGATAQSGFTNPDVLATVSKVAIWSFAIVVAVNQIGIAAALLMATFGALALAINAAEKVKAEAQCESQEPGPWLPLSPPLQT